MSRGRTTRTTALDAFVGVLRTTGHVGQASAAAALGRRTAYELRRRDRHFAAAWDLAIEEHDRHQAATAAAVRILAAAGYRTT